MKHSSNNKTWKREVLLFMGMKKIIKIIRNWLNNLNKKKISLILPIALQAMILLHMKTMKTIEIVLIKNDILIIVFNGK